MDILFRGQKPDDVEYEGSCNVLSGGCNTRVKFKRAEAREVNGDPKGIGKGYLVVTCPVCDKEIRSFFQPYHAPAVTWKDM